MVFGNGILTGDSGRLKVVEDAVPGEGGALCGKLSLLRLVVEETAVLRAMNSREHRL